MTATRERVGEAVGRALARLDERRQALGLVGLAEQDAQLRMRALDRLTVDQYVHLLSLAAEPRAGMIAALEAAQRRAHELEIGWVGASNLDGRLLFRWSCACMARSAGDFFVAETARADWRRHAGIPEGGKPRAGRPPGAPRARAHPEPTE